MTRRKLLSLLAAIPLVGRFVPQPAPSRPYLYGRAVSATGAASPWRGIPMRHIRASIEITPEMLSVQETTRSAIADVYQEMIDDTAASLRERLAEIERDERT